MISSTYLRVMARYNRWQNGEIFAAADRLSEQQRNENKGLFWHSIHGTLSHIYWADRIWLSRFDLVEAPDVGIKESGGFVDKWSDLKSERIILDDKLVQWCDDYDAGPVSGDLEWFSGAVGKEVKAPLAVVLTHFFNHQTHHRGQVHALLTAAGETTADTDLFLMPEELWPPNSS